MSFMNALPQARKPGPLAYEPPATPKRLAEFQERLELYQENEPYRMAPCAED